MAPMNPVVGEAHLAKQGGESEASFPPWSEHCLSKQVQVNRDMEVSVPLWGHQGHEAPKSQAPSCKIEIWHRQRSIWSDKKLFSVEQA